MNKFLKIAFKLIFVKLSIISVILFAPGIPPHVEILPYSLSSPQELASNSILDKAEPLELDREINGPESIALRRDELYAGLKYGQIVKIKDGKVTVVAKTGSECEGYWDEKACGRPLGMRFDSQGKLVFADGSLGLLRVDVESGQVETLTSSEEVIDGKMALIPNDLDVDEDGNIYWSVLQTSAGIDNGLLDLFTGQASGRLMKYNAKTNKSEVLIEGLHWANGVQLSNKRDFVMVAEFVKRRIHRYYIAGPMKGKREVFVDRLPSHPDNIRPNGKGGYYVSMVYVEIPNSESSLIDVLAERPLLRKFILRVQSLLISLVDAVEFFIGPKTCLKKAKTQIRFFGNPDNAATSKKVTIVEFDESGVITGSLQNKNSQICAVSQAIVGKEHTYFGTFLKKQIWRIRNDYLS